MKLKNSLLSVMLLRYCVLLRWLVMVVLMVLRIGCVRFVRMIGNVSVRMC